MQLIQMSEEDYGIPNGQFKFGIRSGEYNIYKVKGMHFKPIYPTSSACFKLEFLYE